MVVPEQDPKKDTRTLPETQGGAGEPDILTRIVATKREEVAALQGRRGALEREAASAPAPRPFRGALDRPGEVAVIAEVKRRSPGAGEIRPGLDPVDLAGSYAAGGAAALSVLTDAPYFGGSLEDLRRVREVVPIPLLRKDFIIDPLQVWEARGAGADAILLIVRILDDDALGTLLRLGGSLGMGVLVEVHDRAEVRRALAVGAGIIGINNRDLATFRTDLAVTESLLSEIPESVLVVSESGMRARGDVERVGAAGAHAVLIGEGLLKAPAPGEATAGLVGCRRLQRVGQPG